jgi:hypothetical protein
MKKTLITSLIALGALLGAAVGSQIGTLAWDHSNIQTLRSFDKAAVVTFLTQWGGREGHPGALTPQEVWEFEWVDLVGDGQYELVVTSSSGPCCVFLGIYRKDAAGTVSVQILEGARKLSDTIRHLNGDGKAELIVWTTLAAPGTWLPMAETPRWPAVYRLQNGKYVEASRDFPSFYDNDVLPKLDNEIRKAPNQDASAIPALARNKILRVLGRDPVAGLNQAYQWMNSDDPQVLQCAIATFADIGGHEKEVRELQQALPAAEKREMESRGGG